MVVIVVTVTFTITFSVRYLEVEALTFSKFWYRSFFSVPLWLSQCFMFAMLDIVVTSAYKSLFFLPLLFLCVYSV